MCREGVLEHIFDRLFLARENSTILIVELLLLEQLMGSRRTSLRHGQQLLVPDPEQRAAPRGAN